jgi:hypothetical protein
MSSLRTAAKVFGVGGLLLAADANGRRSANMRAHDASHAPYINNALHAHIDRVCDEQSDFIKREFSVAGIALGFGAILAYASSGKKPSAADPRDPPATPRPGAPSA